MKTGRDRDESIERLLRRSQAGSDSSAAAACPDAETLAAWVDGGLGERELALVEAHASNCARCQTLLAAVVQTAPEKSPSVSQESWRHGLGLRWLVPLAATAAAAVILWVAVPSDQRVEPPGQLGAQLSKSSPPQPPSEADTNRFNAPAAAQEQPEATDAAKAAKADDKTAGAGPSEGEREVRKENAASADQTATDRLDTQGAQARAVARQAKAAPLEISSPDPAVRWRIGAGGSVEHTTNGGINWEAAPTGVSSELTAGASPSPLICWLIGRAGTVLLSTDGRTWRHVPFPEMTDLAAVQAADGQTATITTADGRKLRTTDGGRTWN